MCWRGITGRLGSEKARICVTETVEIILRANAMIDKETK